MSEEEIVELVIRHDSSIEHLAESLGRIATSSEKQDEKIDLVLESLGQNALILEKIANIDSSNKESISRVHKRIDDALVMVKEKEVSFNERLITTIKSAEKGRLVYDILVTVAIAVPTIATILSGVLWAFDKYYKG